MKRQWLVCVSKCLEYGIEMFLLIPKIKPNLISQILESKAKHNDEDCEEYLDDEEARDISRLNEYADYLVNRQR